jgi:hypothetical protein
MLTQLLIGSGWRLQALCLSQCNSRGSVESVQSQGGGGKGGAVTLWERECLQHLQQNPHARRQTLRMSAGGGRTGGGVTLWGGGNVGRRALVSLGWARETAAAVGWAKETAAAVAGVLALYQSVSHSQAACQQSKKNKIRVTPPLLLPPTSPLPPALLPHLPLLHLRRRCLQCTQSSSSGHSSPCNISLLTQLPLPHLLLPLYLYHCLRYPRLPFSIRAPPPLWKRRRRRRR